MSKIVLKNGSTITFTGDGDKLTGCQPDWVMRHLIYDGLTDEQKVIAARKPGKDTFMMDGVDPLDRGES